MDHIQLQFTTAKFQSILKARIAEMEGLIQKNTDDADRLKRAAAEFGTAIQQHGLVGHNSPVDGYRAEIARVALIHDNLVPDATFCVNADEVLAVVYGGRYGVAYGAMI